MRIEILERHINFKKEPKYAIGQKVIAGSRHIGVTTGVMFTGAEWVYRLYFVKTDQLSASFVPESKLKGEPCTPKETGKRTARSPIQN